MYNYKNTLLNSPYDYKLLSMKESDYNILNRFATDIYTILFVTLQIIRNLRDFFQYTNGPNTKYENK